MRKQQFFVGEIAMKKRISDNHAPTITAQLLPRL